MLGLSNSFLVAAEQWSHLVHATKFLREDDKRRDRADAVRQPDVDRGDEASARRRQATGGAAGACGVDVGCRPAR